MSTADTAATVKKDKVVDTGLTAAFAGGNTTTKSDLFSRAKDAIEAGEQSLHNAAEALALAQQDFDATQREIAEAVGKSAAWVNRLLRWRTEGCPGSPFGPDSRAGRERKKRVQSTEQRTPHNAGTEGPEADTEKSLDETARQEADPTTMENNPLAGFKSAVDRWFTMMDDETRREAVEYAIAKRG